MHTWSMPAVLSRCRTALTRHRGLRVFWLLTLLGLLCSGVPRWEVHSHALADHDPAHHVTGHAHDAIAAEPSGVPSEVLDESILHVHGLLAPALALADVAIPMAVGPAPSMPDFSDTTTVAPALRWPPPHRPPIA